MARRRTTFGKLQRDLEKQAKAKAKAERRQARAAEQSESGEQGSGTGVDQDKVLADLAALHQAFDDGEIGLDDFEAQKEELTSRLRID